MANNLRDMFQAISENIELGEFNLEDIPEVELPENFKEDFYKKYLTVDAAKNDSGLMGHFKGKYLSSSDVKVNKNLKEAGFTDEEITEMKNSVDGDSLKLIDLAFNKIRSIKSDEKPAKDDKALEKLKIESGQEIDKLNNTIKEMTENKDSVISENDSKWRTRFVSEKIASKLNAKTYNNGMDKADAVYLIQRKMEDSNYLIQLDKDLKFEIRDKNDPETLAISEGKPVTIDSILDEYSQPYTAKNDQVKKPTTQTVTVKAGEDELDGKYIVGHKDYGKK